MTVGEFLERVYDCAGDALRATGWYDDGHIDVLYVRPDIDRTTGRGEIRSIHRTAREGTPPDGPGTGDAAVWTRDGTVAVDVPADPSSGTLLSLDDLDGDLRALLADRAPGPERVALRGGSDRKTERCPHCGSKNYEVRSQRPGRPRKSAGAYQCRYCGEAFDSPVLAESRLEVQRNEE